MDARGECLEVQSVHTRDGRCGTTTCPSGATIDALFRTVSPEYFCNLDGNLQRMDHVRRPELNRGTIDFAVPSDYWATNPPQRLAMPYFSAEPPPSGPRRPLPLNYVFALDVSNEAQRSGLLHTACASILDILFGPNACCPPESEIAILTFDVTLHFYDLSVRPAVPLLPLANGTSDRASQISSRCSFLQTSTRSLSRYAVVFL